MIELGPSLKKKRSKYDREALHSTTLLPRRIVYALPYVSTRQIMPECHVMEIDVR